jgi:hypothetical protein
VSIVISLLYFWAFMACYRENFILLALSFLLGNFVKTSRMQWPFYRRERSLVPIVQEVVWAPEPVHTDAKNLTPPGFEPSST